MQLYSNILEDFKIPGLAYLMLETKSSNSYSYDASKSG